MVLLCRFILHLRQDYFRYTSGGRNEHSLLSDMSHARFAVAVLDTVRDMDNLESIDAAGNSHQGMDL